MVTSHHGVGEAQPVLSSVQTWQRPRPPCQRRLHTGVAPLASIDVLGPEVADQLHRDGRAAAQHLALLLVGLVGTLDRLPVDAFVLGEVGVFGGDHRAFQVHGDSRVRDPGVAQAGRRLALRQARALGAHEAGLGRIEGAPPGDGAQEPELHGKYHRRQHQQAAQQPAAQPFHARPISSRNCR